MPEQAASASLWPLPTTVAEVPPIRRIGMGYSQVEGWIESVCTCPEPCNTVYCPNLADLPHVRPNGDFRADTADA